MASINITVPGYRCERCNHSGAPPQQRGTETPSLPEVQEPLLGQPQEETELGNEDKTDTQETTPVCRRQEREESTRCTSPN